MKPLDPDHIAETLSQEFGIEFLGESGTTPSGTNYLELHPADLTRNNGFRIVITPGWRRLELRFLHGPFASEIIQAMGSTVHEKGDVFSDLVATILNEGATFRMVVNDERQNPRQPETWPPDWTRLSLEMIKSPLAINTEDPQETEKAVLRWGSRFLACVLNLVPLEEESNSIADLTGLPEGAMTRIEVNRYERNHLNRATCLQVHGYNCMACETSFESVYGEIGAGFIHVHHTTPVSELGEKYQINPVTDLVPVCPNCHAMLHRRNPPLSIAELKDIIASQRSYAGKAKQFAKAAEDVSQYETETSDSTKTDNPQE